MKTRFLFALSIAVFCLSVVEAQNPPELARVLLIYREDGKPARGPAHSKVEQGFAQFWARQKVQPFLALEAWSGNPNEVMFISGYDSLASMEKDYQAFGRAANGPEYESLIRQEAELINGVRSTVALLRPDLSYRSDRFMSVLPQCRYFAIETFRVRPGKDAEFEAGSKQFQNAFEKMKRDIPYVMYQVIMGAAEGTYLLFFPLKSLKDLDDDYASQGSMVQAMGEENMKNLMKTAGDVFLSLESNVYAFNPNMSNVSKEFAAGDPKFWTAPKPAVKKVKTAQ